MIPDLIVSTGHVDEESIEQAVRGVGVVYHLAALPSVPRSIDDPRASHQSGDDLTFKMLYYAKEAGVKRFVYASSSSVYGGKNRLPQKEDSPLYPLSPYAATKMSGEAMCHSFARCYGMDTVSLRFFNVYGPRQNPGSPYSGVISKFCKAFVSGGDVEIFGTGEQSRDFTYVSDVVEALILAGEKEADLDGIAINVGTHNTYSILDVLNTLKKITGEDKEPAFSPPRPGDAKRSMADINRAKNILKYDPKVSLEAGLEDTLDWYRRDK